MELKIKPFEKDNDYLVYSDGRIWSNKSNRFLKSSMRGQYLSVGLVINKKKMRYDLHRILAETFIPNPNNLLQVNHIDENKLNNSLDNLEWVSAKDNANHGTRNQRISERNKELFPNGCGSKGEHPESKAILMCEPITKNILKEFDSISSACEFLNKSNGQPNITAVTKGRRKTAYGYYWCFKNE